MEKINIIFKHFSEKLFGLQIPLNLVEKNYFFQRIRERGWHFN
jgi:hypothetical protein